MLAWRVSTGERRAKRASVPGLLRERAGKTNSVITPGTLSMIDAHSAVSGVCMCALLLCAYSATQEWMRDRCRSQQIQQIRNSKLTRICHPPRVSSRRIPHKSKGLTKLISSARLRRCAASISCKAAACAVFAFAGGPCVLIAFRCVRCVASWRWAQACAVSAV